MSDQAWDGHEYDGDYRLETESLTAQAVDVERHADWLLWTPEGWSDGFQIYHDTPRS